MSEVAAIGTHAEIAGFGLAGARTYPVETAEAALAAWQGLPPTVAIVILTETTAGALADQLTQAQAPLPVVIPR